MSKRVLLIITAIIVALAAMIATTQRDLFTAEGRGMRALRSLERSGLVVRRSCYSSETFVNASAWGRMAQADQQRAAQVLGAYCSQQGSSGEMTILDAESRQKLAHWDRATLQRF
jgi:hypothetical protein